MQIERISVPVGKREPLSGKLVPTGDTESVLVLCDDVFAICPGGRDEDTGDQLFKITHRPTGYVVTAVVWDYALEIIQEIRRRGVERWAFTDPAYAKTALAAEWHEIKAAARRNIGGVWLEESPPTADAVDPSAAGTGKRTTRA